MSLPRQAAHLCGIFIALSIWGIYTCLFIVTLYVLKRRGAKYTHAFGAICALYVLNLVETVVDTTKVYQAFITSSEGAVVYFAARNDAFFQTWSDAILISSVLIADSVLFWRLYIIWSKNRKIAIFTSIYLTIGIAGGIIVIVYDVLLDIHGPLPHLLVPSRIIQWVLFLVDVATNLTLTAMIAGRLWWVGRQARALSGRKSNRYQGAVLAFVESGFLLTFTMGAYAVVGLVKSKLVSLVSYSLPRIVGMVPLMILLQLSLGYTQPHDTVQSIPRSTHAPQSETALGTGPYKMQSVSVRRATKSEPRKPNSFYFDDPGINTSPVRYVERQKKNAGGVDEDLMALSEPVRLVLSPTPVCPVVSRRNSVEQ